ncbi:MAG: M20 peptidase aminoacylase family protein [Bacillus sp. (in: firmicutes)]
MENFRTEILSIFNHLHNNPETSWNEVQTTAYVKGILESCDCVVTTFEDCTGVVAELGSGEFTVGLRSDMDALWQEVKGMFQANHSCGHDAHMTMVLGVILYMKQINYQPPGKMKFIFQPAEEKGTGALKMLEENVLDDVDFLYGVHLRPGEEVSDGKASPAIMHGAAQFLSGEIIGTDAHAARPHQGQNAIEIGAHFVTLLNSIHLNPVVPYSVKMTQFSAGGESGNIIPGKATFSLDLRAQTNEVMEQLINRVENIASTLASTYGVEIRLQTEGNVAAAIMNDQALMIMKEAIAETLGEENVVHPVSTTGGEDFHFYTLKKTHIKATMLGLGCDLQPGLHHPDMTFNQEALFEGIEILTKAIMKTFQQQRKDL